MHKVTVIDLLVQLLVVILNKISNVMPAQLNMC